MGDFLFIAVVETLMRFDAATRYRGTCNIRQADLIKIYFCFSNGVMLEHQCY